jgi:hypothetical protein
MTTEDKRSLVNNNKLQYLSPQIASQGGVGKYEIALKRRLEAKKMNAQRQQKIRAMQTMLTEFY